MAVQEIKCKEQEKWVFGRITIGLKISVIASVGVVEVLMKANLTFASDSRKVV